jgi:hypothetical protein
LLSSKWNDLPWRPVIPNDGSDILVFSESPVELDAELSNPWGTSAANNPERRVANVPTGIRELRVVEDVEEFDSKIESNVLFKSGVL